MLVELGKLQELRALHNARGALWRLLQALPHILWRASAEWNQDNAPRLGASVAFYTLLSLAPVIVIAVAVGAAVYGREAAEGRLAWEIQGIAGAAVARTIQEIIKGAYQPGTGSIATLLGLATLVFGASSIFVELHDAMNTIWKVPQPEDQKHADTIVRIIRARFFSFLTVLGIGFLLLVSLVWNTWVVAMRIEVPPAANFMIFSLVTALLFAALYKIVPDVPLQWSDVAPGAILTAVLFMVGKHFLALYFANTHLVPTYSAAGSPLIVLLWVYYSAQLFFWGVEFCKVYTRTLGSQRDAQTTGSPAAT